MSDLELLRQYEPILRFTQGELFFPRAVDEYVRACSLWELAVSYTHLDVYKRQE